MQPQTTSRLWVILGIGIAVVGGLLLLMAFVGRGPGEPAPMITPVPPTPADDPAVASVNGQPIRQSFWVEAVLLDQVMSGLAGQPAPAPDETLQRLINEELVLQAQPPERQPSTEEIEDRIITLEQAWGVNDDAVGTALDEVGLTRAAFEQSVGRLLAVEASLAALQSQGHDTTTWLAEQRAGAEIVIHHAFDNPSVPYVPIPESPIPTPGTSPIPTPETGMAALSPIPAPPTAIAVMPSPPPTPAIPEIAPDFTLERSGGGTLTLTEQLARGPVILTFFHRQG
jgi:hypothetical protein